MNKFLIILVGLIAMNTGTYYFIFNKNNIPQTNEIITVLRKVFNITEWKGI